MRAREIIFRYYNDMYTKDLNRIIKKKIASGDGFEARIYSTRLDRWIRAATSETVTSSIMGSLKAKMRQHKKDCGREKLTMRDLNRLRKERYALTHEKYNDLQTKETMYGNNDSE